MSSSFEKVSMPAPENTKSALEKRIEELREAVRGSIPFIISEKTGASYTEMGHDRGEFRLMLWDSPVVISCPGLIAYDLHDDLLSTPYQGLLMYYFAHADGSPLSGRWVSYADLPGGRNYAKAFQGYSGDKIVKVFQLDIGRFEKACLKAGGLEIEFGEASFIFPALPRVPLVATYHQGEDEFPSSCQILFDSAVENYLPIDVCAILASMLTGRVINSDNSLQKDRRVK